MLNSEIRKSVMIDHLETSQPLKKPARIRIAEKFPEPS